MKSPRSAVLFVLIGWARRYDGTESIAGNHAYLQEHPKDNAEIEAFVRQANGYYYCGAGKGELHEDLLDIVFVALDQNCHVYKVVGFYRQAEVTETGEWTTVRTKQARLFPVKQRPVVAVWPVGQGMRRWAYRVSSSGNVHTALLLLYRSLASSQLSQPSIPESEDLDPEMSGFEGKQQVLFIKHRRREAKLRAAKVRHALQDGNGHLRCEVPGCGFDFLRTYGEIGRRYALVHHTKPLAALGSKGATTLLSDLAIVCANCHAMIHRGGQCRSLRAVRPRRQSR